MDIHPILIAISPAIILTLTPHSTATEASQLFDPLRYNNGYFGRTSAVSTSLIAISSNGNNKNLGSVTLFSPSRGSFSFSSRIDGTRTGTGFGHSVALSDQTILIGAPWEDENDKPQQGAVYVFVKSGSEWIQQARLTAPDGVAKEGFGYSVAIRNDTCVIGKPSDASGGSAYVFLREGNDWLFASKITPSSGGRGSFGANVQLLDNTLVICAPNASGGSLPQSGAALVYSGSKATWTLEATLTADDRAAQGNFAVCASITPNTILVGAPYHDNGSQHDSGAAYVFSRNGNTWTQHAKLTALNGSAGDFFGQSVAISGNVALVGAPLDDDGPSQAAGSAYVFSRTGSTWTQQTKLALFAGSAFDWFGYSVAIANGLCICTSPYYDFGNTEDCGAAWIFNIESILCNADLNGDRMVNVADLSFFLGVFGANTLVFPQAAGADFNGDGRVDSADLSVLLTNFGRSCAE